MADLISRAAAIDELMQMVKRHEHEIFRGELLHYTVIKAVLEAQPAVDAVPIKPLSVWLAGYAVPPKYTVATNPVDSVKARAEGWEQHIRNLIECGLMEDE